jgi:hypothetical protein
MDLQFWTNVTQLVTIFGSAFLIVGSILWAMSRFGPREERDTMPSPSLQAASTDPIPLVRPKHRAVAQLEDRIEIDPHPSTKRSFQAITPVEERTTVRMQSAVQAALLNADPETTTEQVRHEAIEAYHQAKALLADVSKVRHGSQERQRCIKHANTLLRWAADEMWDDADEQTWAQVSTWSNLAIAACRQAQA